MTRWRRGFTLLETLVALAILSVFAAAILMTLGGSTEAERRARRAAEIEEARQDLLRQLAAHNAPLPPKTEGETPAGLSWEITILEEVSASDAPTAPRLQTLAVRVAARDQTLEDVAPLVTRHFGVGQPRPL